MAGSFLDTSALAKRYHVESGSLAMDELWADDASPLFISRLGAVEVISVFAGKVRTGALTGEDFQAVRRRFLADVALGRPKLLRMLVAHFKDAERLVRQHGLVRQLRTLDA